MSDRSLDDFLSDSGDEEAKTDEDDSPETTDEDEAGVPEEVVEPAVATATGSPDGASCEDCGETVRRRWHDDGAYVCGDCKEW